MRSSDYIYREAGEDDLSSIEDLFAHRGIRRGWAEWKYFQNPDGIARVFVAEDRNGTIIGILAYMPRRFSYDGGSSLTAMVCVDFYIVSGLRDRGVFLRLLNFAGERVDEAQLAVPNHYSTIFSSGPGWRTLGPFCTWQFPILIDGYFTKEISPLITRILNGLVKLYQFSWLPGKHKNIRMVRLERFRNSYKLGRDAIQGVRSADYLNWRFMENPVGEYFAYEFFEDDESIGYCVFSKVESQAVLADFVAMRCRRGCLSALIAHCRKARIYCLTYSGTGLQLGTLGFILSRDDLKCRGYRLQDGHWVVNSCDIDFEPRRMLAKSSRSQKAEAYLE